ncbi:hypothetical protein GZ997_11520 [Actinomyces sp. 565]|nr:hypothetical protein [Actinomyces sp. 565]
MSDDNCEFCNNVADDVANRHEAGNWVDPWEQEITPLEWWTDQEDPNRYVVRAQVTSEARTSHSGDGTATRVEESEDLLLTQLYWTGEQWRIEAIEVENGGDQQ